MKKDKNKDKIKEKENKNCSTLLHMDWNKKSGLLTGVFFLTLIGLVGSCLKKDNLPPGGDPGLTNLYCNDPNAINYNWGFPGVPNDSICIFPVDSFIGNWAFSDSIFNPDSSFNAINSGVFNFQSTEDTVHTHLKLSGLCPSATALMLTATKYGQATLDSLDENNPGQFFCSSADTAVGTFQFQGDYHDTLIFNLQLTGTHSGFHKGMAVRQP